MWASGDIQKMLANLQLCLWIDFLATGNVCMDVYVSFDMCRFRTRLVKCGGALICSAS